MRIINIITIAAAALLTVSCGGGKQHDKPAPAVHKATVSIDTALRSRLKVFASKPRPQGNFGLYVYDITAQKPVFGSNEHQPQPSASCMKLLSGVAGLHLLGTRYLYPTSVYTRGNIEGDTLKGDIAFKAALDPQLQPEDISMIMKHLRRKGIRRFTGKLYIDLRLHEPVKSEAHWYPWDLSFSKYGILYKGEDKVVRAVRQAMRQQGLQTADSQVVVAQMPKDMHCVFRLYRHINKVIERMWKNSSNTQATALLYTIGDKYKPGTADPTAAGVEYMRKFVRDELKSQEKGIVIHDGCGLCTYNQLSPYFLCEVLRYGHRDPGIFRALSSFLSISGVDGTLRRMPYQLRGRVRAKTGTLSHPYGISSLAGYCRTDDGHLLCFAIMDSDMSVLDAHVLQRNLCKVLVNC